LRKKLNYKTFTNKKEVQMALTEEEKRRIKKLEKSLVKDS